MDRELICICCPKGCHLKVNAEANKVSGNSCPRGVEYGINEVTNPVRVITSTVKVRNGDVKLVPVKTSSAIPKELNFKCMNEINKAIIEAPIKVGDIIIKNILDTGIDIIATKNIKVRAN